MCIGCTVHHYWKNAYKIINGISVDAPDFVLEWALDKIDKAEDYSLLYNVSKIKALRLLFIETYLETEETKGNLWKLSFDKLNELWVEMEKDLNTGKI